MAISKKQYDALVRSYREEPGGVSKAAREAGVSRPTARKAWTTGWEASPDATGDLMPPIKDVILEEQRATRASLMERQATAAAEDAEKARGEVIATRRQEAELVRGERGNVMGLVAVTGTMLRGAMQQAREIEKCLREGVDEAGKKITLRQKIDYLEKIGRLVRTAGETAVDVIRMERLLLGEPTDILGIRNLDSITEDEAIRELREGGEVAKRMEERRQRRLTLIQGGGSAATRAGVTG